MQSDAVAVGAVDMGIPPVAPTTQSEHKRGDYPKEAQHHRECFERGYVSSYEREVFLPLLCPSVGADSCPVKIHDSGSRVE